MSFKTEAIYQLGARASMTTGLGRNYLQRAIQIIQAIPEDVVDETLPKEEAPKWTSVNTKPKKKGMYLTFIRCPEGAWIEIDKYIGKGQWENPYGAGDPTDYIDYWMPLPAFPEG